MASPDHLPNVSIPLLSIFYCYSIASIYGVRRTWTYAQPGTRSSHECGHAIRQDPRGMLQRLRSIFGFSKLASRTQAPKHSNSLTSENSHSALVAQSESELTKKVIFGSESQQDQQYYFSQPVGFASEGHFGAGVSLIQCRWMAVPKRKVFTLTA